MGWFNRLHRQNNTVGADVDSAKKPKGNTVTLKLGDKHEPFGALSIDRIKSILEEEDFAQMQSLFFYMMRDLKISSVISARRQPLLGLSYKIDTDNEPFKEWLSGSGTDMGGLITQLSYAVYYGVSLVDVDYTVQDAKLVPQFGLVSPRFLHAHKDTTLKRTEDHLYIKQGDSKLFINALEKNRAVFHKHPVDIGEITDFSLANKLVWYFSLKHLAMAHNVTYFDNVATPPLIAKTEGGDEDELVDSLYTLKSSSVGVFGKDDVIEYLKVDSKADFLAFIEYIDRQIATLVLGNTLSTGEGKGGSYSQSQTHENRQTETLHFDARLIEATISGFLTQLEALNFASPKGVKFEFTLTEKKDLKDLSIVVKNLSDAGFELDSEDLEAQFGLKILGKKQPLSEASAPSEKADNQIANSLGTAHAGGCACASCNAVVNNSTELPQYADHLDSQAPPTQTLEQVLINSIETALKQAGSFDEAYQVMLEQYQGLPLDTLEAALFQAVANSQILADAEVVSEYA